MIGTREYNPRLPLQYQTREKGFDALLDECFRGG